MNPILSVVVPVYNVEKYIHRCVNSLTNQSFKDIEIILVDDGSPDACPSICDDLLKTDKRIKVIHKRNGGLSSARNAGMRIARGKYIGFVDSDDDVELDMYEKMVRTAEQTDVDFVMCDYIRIDKCGNKYLKSLDIRTGVYNKDNIRETIYPSLIMGENLEYGPLLSVWQCIYRMDFLKKHELQFDEEVIWSEDNIFSAFIGYHANSFYYLKGSGLYHYYENYGTITTSYRKGSWLVYCTMNDHLKSFFEQVDDYDFSRQLALHLMFYACNCISQLMTLDKKHAISGLREIINSDRMSSIMKTTRMPKVHIKLYIQLILMKYHMVSVLYYLKKN